MSDREPSQEELEARLAQAEETLAALQSGQVDTIVGSAGPLSVLAKSVLDENRQLLAALRASEERNRLIGEAISDYAYSFVVAPDGTMRCDWLNDAFVHVFGFDLAAIEARGGWSSMILPDDRPILMTHVEKVIGGQPDTCEMRFVTRRGEVRWIVDYAIPVRAHESGPVARIFGAAQDITVRKKLEARLEAERANLQAFVDATPAAVFMVDEQEFIIRANPEAEILFGTRVGPGATEPYRCGDLAKCVHSRDDVRGCGFGPVCPSCQVNQAVKRALAGETVRNLEASLTIETNGSTAERHFVLGAAPVTFDSKPFAALAMQDVTEGHNAQAEREQLRAALAQSDRLACMGTLAAGVAHEINNPLSYVLYNVESAAEDLPELADFVRRCHDALYRHLGPEEAARVISEQPNTGLPAAIEDVVDRLRETASGAYRIKDIARGLGTFSRVDQDQVAPVQLQLVIEQALNMAFNQIKYRARVVKDFGSIPAVIATDGKLAQVFLNLLINAAHAIDEGHVEENEIRIRTWAEGEAVFAEVSDTGKGIAPEHRDHIFEPFFTTKRVGVGTGLGLAISRNLVTGFGGRISFSTEVGVGTRFLVELPCLPRDWQTGEASTQQGAPVRPSIRGRVLVVDDERGVRATIARMLGRDHEVVTAASGEEAQVILEQDRRFDLIFCDLMMPRISGMELHAWLEERDAALAAQVVFITGGAFTPGASEYLARVGNLRVEKPFDTVTFKNLTGELLLAARAKRDRER